MPSPQKYEYFRRNLTIKPGLHIIRLFVTSHAYRICFEPCELRPSQRTPDFIFIYISNVLLLQFHKVSLLRMNWRTFLADTTRRAVSLRYQACCLWALAGHLQSCSLQGTCHCSVSSIRQTARAWDEFTGSLQRARRLGVGLFTGVVCGAYESSLVVWRGIAVIEVYAKCGFDSIPEIFYCLTDLLLLFCAYWRTGPVAVIVGLLAEVGRQTNE